MPPHKKHSRVPSSPWRAWRLPPSALLLALQLALQCPAAAAAAAVGSGGRKTAAEQLERHRFLSCQKRVALTDFAMDQFQNAWMSETNMTDYMICVVELRAAAAAGFPLARGKQTHVGGIHYPTIAVTNHREPVVSTSGVSWCWLDKNTLQPNGLDPAQCCDTKHGPRGLAVCWDQRWTFELCCQGELLGREMPHFFSVPAYDINVGNTLRHRGTFDLRMSYALQAICRRGDVVLDVGANLGAFTVPMAERVGPQGVVHAFEPFRLVFQHLNANVALNGLSNVYTHNVAIGRQEKVLEIYAPDLTTFNTPSAMRVGQQKTREAAARFDHVAYEQAPSKVAVKTLDSFDFGPRVDVIKIDVEFMELEVVLGARETINRYRPVIWAENEPYFKKKDRTFVEAMASNFGYDCQPVADLELLCTPPLGRSAEVVEGFGRLFQHLNRPLKHISLQQVIGEVDPKFATLGLR